MAAFWPLDLPVTECLSPLSLSLSFCTLGCNIDAVQPSKCPANRLRSSLANEFYIHTHTHTYTWTHIHARMHTHAYPWKNRIATKNRSAASVFLTQCFNPSSYQPLMKRLLFIVPVTSAISLIHSSISSLYFHLLAIYFSQRDGSSAFNRHGITRNYQNRCITLVYHIVDISHDYRLLDYMTFSCTRYNCGMVMRITLAATRLVPVGAREGPARGKARGTCTKVNGNEKSFPDAFPIFSF